MKYYLIAGEASGDLHGSNLVKALKKQDNQAQFQFWGGDLMAQELGKPRKHIQDLAFMGFYEVVKNLPTILNNIKFCKTDILQFAPDVLILIDYPGFNLRIAKWAKTMGIQVFYYISPQLWAWHSSRAKTIKACVDRMYVILPFEKEFYKKYQLEVDFVGHPLLDVVEGISYQKADGFNLPPKAKTIALLPGSRKQEIKKMLTEMLAMVSKFADYHFVIAGAPSIEMTVYEEIINDFFKDKGIPKNLRILQNQTHFLLRNSYAALVTSGTATLETALFEVPQIVCYKGNALSFLLARQLVNVEYISLVNLIAEKEVVKELIQKELNPDNLKVELIKILDLEFRNQMIESYQEVKKKLGGVGASERAAKLMVDRL
ncbi:MAG: lipid-A-disaccharide synthase [Bacteroidetes bacterium]|jgi:lipid-A-disaccharide synthase|nr:lipid-A-disaccharide synthase [Bacteroidota bacterium]MDF1864367.1 lipid-A-disaccharide synthase [Saprospiraceae bacterium]